MERVADHLDICKRPYGVMFYHDVEMATRLFNLVTGKDRAVAQLLKVSEGVRNLE